MGCITETKLQKIIREIEDGIEHKFLDAHYVGANPLDSMKNAIARQMAEEVVNLRERIERIENTAV